MRHRYTFFTAVVGMTALAFSSGSAHAQVPPSELGGYYMSGASQPNPWQLPDGFTPKDCSTQVDSYYKDKCFLAIGFAHADNMLAAESIASQFAKDWQDEALGDLVDKMNPGSSRFQGGGIACNDKLDNGSYYGTDCIKYSYWVFDWKQGA